MIPQRSIRMYIIAFRTMYVIAYIDLRKLCMMSYMYYISIYI